MYRRKTSHLQALFTALTTAAKTLGYKCHAVPGRNGQHHGYPHQEKEIFVGRDQSLTDRIVVLAHEIGHALDLFRVPISMMEMIAITLGWEKYKLSREYYERERQAWCHAERLLRNMGGYKAVRTRFKRLKEEGLSAYYQLMTEHWEKQNAENTHANTGGAG
jgi:hypothetical protein